MKNILVIGNGASVLRGGSIFTHNHTLEYLEELGSNENIAVCYSQPLIEASVNQSLQNREMDLSKVSHLNMSILGRIAYFQLLFKKIHDFDLLHVFLPSRVGLYLMLFAKIIGKKYSVYLRGERLSNPWLARYLFNHCEGVATVSSFLAEQCQVPRNKVTAVRPMVDIEKSDVIRAEELAKSSDLLFVGRIEHNKGVFDLVEALAILNKEGLAVKAEIVGAGTDFDSLEKRIRDLALTNVHLLGEIHTKKDILTIYRRNKIFALPTYHEGFPRVIYEAIAADNYIVTTPVGGIPELMKHNENCLIVPVGDPSAIASAIRLLISQPQAMKELKDNARITLNQVLFGDRPHHSKVTLQYV